MAWDEQMDVAMDKLDANVPGTGSLWCFHFRCMYTDEPCEVDKDRGMQLKDLLIQYAREPESASIFNYASMAHNIHFFFEGLV